MEQQIKLDNKNNNEENEEKSIKIRFQASISKYVERKKKELSVISALSEKQNSIKQKRMSAFSNLIDRNTELNFYRRLNQDDSEMLSAIKINLGDQKQRASLVRKKVKGHKSSLSDWRKLYEQREGFVEKHQMSNKYPDKMAITDRLFYPCKKMTHPNFQNEKLKRVAGQVDESAQNNNVKTFQREKNDKQKYFISDQNFFHIYYRSNTPIMDEADQSQKVIKYLKQNRHKRQSHQGLRLMNETILSPSLTKDVSFIPYKIQSKNNTKNHLQHHKNHSFTQTSMNFLISNPVKSPQEKSISQQQRQLSKILSNKNTKICQQNDMQNPQILKVKKDNIIDEKKGINLSEIFSKNLSSNLNSEQMRQINLRLFKPRKNKIQKGISDVKFGNSQNRKNNFQNSLKKIKGGKTCSNWNTIYGQY